MAPKQPKHKATIIALANQKGGVAKTTSVASIGAALAELGRRVLLVDLDPQACLTFSLGVDPDTVERVGPRRAHRLRRARRRRRHAARRASTSCRRPSTSPAPRPCSCRVPVASTSCARRLEGVDTAYDVVLLDCSPSLGVLTLNALTAADALIIPMPCEMLSHRGVGQLLDTVADVQKILNRDLEVWGILPTLYDGRSNHAREVLADVGERYDLPVLEPPIPKTVRFAEAPAVGRSILSTARTSKGAQAYREVATSLLARL